MNERAKTIGLISDMLQQANVLEIRFVYSLLQAMLDKEEVAV